MQITLDWHWLVVRDWLLTLLAVVGNPTMTLESRRLPLQGCLKSEPWNFLLQPLQHFINGTLVAPIWGLSRNHLESCLSCCWRLHCPSRASLELHLVFWVFSICVHMLVSSPCPIYLTLAPLIYSLSLFHAVMLLEIFQYDRCRLPPSCHMFLHRYLFSSSSVVSLCPALPGAWPESSWHSFLFDWGALLVFCPSQESTFYVILIYYRPAVKISCFDGFQPRQLDPVPAHYVHPFHRLFNRCEKWILKIFKSVDLASFVWQAFEI